MCKLGPVADWGDSQPHSRTSASTPAGTSAFTARRLTASTFLIVEGDDVYYEHPFIYIKIVPAARAILLLDTGCGGKTGSRGSRERASQGTVREFPKPEPNQSVATDCGGKG